jgi:hypothetical protein
LGDGAEGSLGCRLANAKTINKVPMITKEYSHRDLVIEVH